MAGGTWLSQNKTRPGAYINFKSAAKAGMAVGSRGVVAIPLQLKWGKEGELIEVESEQLLDGSSQKLVGFTGFDSDSKLLSGALSYAYKALVYRMNTGGVVANVDIGRLHIVANCSGSFGNKIIIRIDEITGGLKKVTTYVNGTSVDVQKVSEISELETNDYVTFSELEEGDFEANAGAPLAGGTDGEVDETVAYPAFFALLKKAKWQTLACTSSVNDIKSNAIDFISGLRDDNGVYVQGVVSNYDGADTEGIINSVNGAVIDGVEYSKEEFVAIVAGMTAGANFNESNTAKVVTGATSIVGEMTDSEIEEALENGKFLLSKNEDGDIKVEQDINSLHTFTKEKDYTFSKNRVIRTLDEIGTTVKSTWEKSYMGKVDNNATGRSLFKGDLIAYGNELQRLNAIQEFDGTEDITISQGGDLDSVVVDLAIKPVDSMEKLYMTITVNS